MRHGLWMIGPAITLFVVLWMLSAISLQEKAPPQGGVGGDGASSGASTAPE